MALHGASALGLKGVLQPLALASVSVVYQASDPTVVELPKVSKRRCDAGDESTCVRLSSEEHGDFEALMKLAQEVRKRSTDEFMTLKRRAGISYLVILRELLKEPLTVSLREEVETFRNTKNLVPPKQERVLAHIVEAVEGGAPRWPCTRSGPSA